jgi:hypothetical protein
MASEVPRSTDSPEVAGSVIEVTAEERRHLAECCAFFIAEHYREAEPGKIRAADVAAGEAQIDAVIEHCGCHHQST